MKLHAIVDKHTGARATNRLGGAERDLFNVPAAVRDS